MSKLSAANTETQNARGRESGSADHVLYIECACHDPEHLLRFSTFGGEVFVNVQLNHHLPFLGRLWAALRFVIGRSSSFPHWAEAIVTEDRQRIADLLRAVKP